MAFLEGEGAFLITGWIFSGLIEVDLIFSIFIGRLNIGSLELEVRFMGGVEKVEGDEEIIGIIGIFQII